MVMIFYFSNSSGSGLVIEMLVSPREIRASMPRLTLYMIMQREAKAKSHPTPASAEVSIAPIGGSANPTTMSNTAVMVMK